MMVLWIWSRLISFSVIVTVLILVSSVHSRQQDYGSNSKQKFNSAGGSFNGNFNGGRNNGNGNTGSGVNGNFNGQGNVPIDLSGLNTKDLMRLREGSIKTTPDLVQTTPDFIATTDVSTNAVTSGPTLFTTDNTPAPTTDVFVTTQGFTTRGITNQPATDGFIRTIGDFITTTDSIDTTTDGIFTTTDGFVRTTDGFVRTTDGLITTPRIKVPVTRFEFNKPAVVTADPKPWRNINVSGGLESIKKWLPYAPKAVQAMISRRYGLGNGEKTPSVLDVTTAGSFVGGPTTDVVTADVAVVTAAPQEVTTTVRKLRRPKKNKKRRNKKKYGKTAGGKSRRPNRRRGKSKRCQKSANKRACIRRNRIQQRSGSSRTLAAFRKRLRNRIRNGVNKGNRQRRPITNNGQRIRLNGVGNTGVRNGGNNRGPGINGNFNSRSDNGTNNRGSGQNGNFNGGSNNGNNNRGSGINGNGNGQGNS